MGEAVQMEGPRKKQGKVYMFLQRDFQEYVPRKEEDIEADIVNVTTCFENLGFDVDIKNIRKYYTKKNIIDALTEESESNIWNEYESIFIFFITHSSANGKLLCEGGSFYDEEMISILIGEKYSDLLKVFVFQASQATQTPGTLPEIESDGNEFPFGIPAEANLFIVKSSFEREALSREDGSYFLKVFCQYLQDIGNGTSLFNIMTAVLCELKANRFEVDEKPRNNILPEVSSTLLKPMYLRSKGKYTFDHSCNEETLSFGKQMVFNFAFPNSPKSRPQTEEDVKVIKECFSRIGFTVDVYNELTADEVRRTIDKGTNCKTKCDKSPERCGPRHRQYDPPNYSNDTCVAVAIMSHGSHQYFRTANANANTKQRMKIVDVISRLIITNKKKKGEDKYEEREDLSGKPKLFFLQMCRSKRMRRGADVPTSSEQTNLPLMSLPLEFDDTLVFHSTYNGNVSYRGSGGTPFIQILCERINQIPDDGSVSLIDVLHDVQRGVVHKVGKHATRGETQMPIIYSTLTKHIFIRKH